MNNMNNMKNMITLTINGKKFEVKGPVKVLEAALQNNIHIPTMCYYPKIESFGGCRMCLVRVEGMYRLQASCSLNAEDGMVVETETPEIHVARKAMLEFMLINHPLDCPTCDKAGECDLQDFSVLYGAAEGRFHERKRTEPESTKDPLIVRNMERCIMCTKCTRVCAELQGASAINVIGRGKHTSIEPFSGSKFDCEYCGACIIACPVGSLMSKLHRHNYRPWDTGEQFDSTCSYCGVGCGIHMQIREDGTLQRLIPAESEVNQGLLCARGFFGYEYISSPSRLTSPLIRKDGKLVPVSWQEALKYVASRLKEIRDASGGKSLAALASPKCTIEDNYLLQKLMRAGLGSNNIDSSARMGLAGLRRIVGGLLGHARTVSYVSEMAQSDAVLTVCSDPVTEAPVLGVRVRNAYDSGAAVITFGHAPGLRHHRSVTMQPRLKEQWHVLGALLSAVLEIKKPSGSREMMQELLGTLMLPTPEDMDDAMPREVVRKVAETLATSANVSLVAGRELACSLAGPWSIMVFAALAHVLEAKVYLISEGPNEHGLLDMGCEPDMLPGPAPMTDAGARRMIEGLWDARLPSEKEKGLSLMEIFEAAGAGDVKGLYVMGENPARSLPDSGFVTDALAKLDLLVVQDIFMTETAELAHVVLPAKTWIERKGTYINMERRLLGIDAGVGAEGKEDWSILSELCEALGLKAGYKRSDDVFSEVMKVSPYYCELHASNIRGETCKWPAEGGDGHDAILDLKALRPYLDIPPVVEGDGFDIVLEKPLFLNGTTALHSDALLRISKEPLARMNTALADSYKIRPGDTLRFFSERGEIEIKAHIDPYLPDNTVYLTDTQESAGILKYFRYNKMPFTNAPCKYTQKTGLKRGE